MARYQIVEIATGRKVNLVEWDGETEFTPLDGLKLEPDDGKPIYVEEAPKERLADISDRQFAQALANMGVITRPEALVFVKEGKVPAALQAVIDAIPDEDERFAADMQVSGATVFERNHPSTLAIAHALKWTDDQMDDLWKQAAAL
jgi:hypothetical protein